MTPNIPVEMRKMEESLETLIQSGFPKQVAKVEKALFDAYIKAGFTRPEALMLVISKKIAVIG